MSELGRLLQIDDSVGTIDLIARMRSLDTNMPDMLYFLEATALHKTGNALAAQDRLLRYLKNTGREGRYYDKATELLLTVREEAAKQETTRKENTERKRRQQVEAEVKALSLRTREAQRLLAQVGYPQTSESGTLDQTTREALAVFQVRKNLQVNALITRETIEKLRNSVPAEDDCDTLAYRARKPSEISINLADIAYQLAVPACNKALRLYPDAARFQIQYARSLLAAGRASNAKTAADKAAQLGYKGALHLLGQIYADGGLNDNDEPDEKTALKWFLEAADKDDPEAQMVVAEYYEDGKGGLKRNSALVVEWQTKAADLTYPPAQVTLARRYIAGSAVSRDYEKAMNLLQKAIEQQYPDAYYHLAEMYERGRGTKRDKTTALKFYRLAKQLGLEAASIKIQRLD
jgi:TPR repeat protein